MNKNIALNIISRLTKKITADDTPISLETDLLFDGIMSSMDFMSLLLALEQEFQTEIDIEDLDAEAPANVANLVTLVCTKKS